MNFWNLAILGMCLFAPAAALVFVAIRGENAPGLASRVVQAALGLAMGGAVLGAARINAPVKMEFLWPLTLEQSGYFEFSLQLFWTRFVWVFFSAALFLGFLSYDGPAGESPLQRRLGWLFLLGSFCASVLGFLCENVLLTVLFLEISGVLLYAYGMESEPGESEAEKSAFFKRSCFIFLSLFALFAMAVSGEFSTSGVMLVGAVLYLVSYLVSRHNPSRWGGLPLLFLHLGMALFLLSRVLVDDSAPEIWAPLSALGGLSAVAFAVLSLLSPAALSSAFWSVFAFLGYLLYLRFSSSHPADSFWGAYEAGGMAMVYALSVMLRFGSRFDLLWKKAAAFAILTLYLGAVAGALPNVEAVAIRFDSETTILRVAALGFLTFLISVISARGLSLSFEKPERPSTPRDFFTALAPSILLLAAQAALMMKWKELNLEDFGSSALAALLYEPRALVTGIATVAGMLTGGFLGRNHGFAQWVKSRDPRMEGFFPGVEPALLRRTLDLALLPEKGIGWISNRLSAAGAWLAGLLDGTDRRFFGERLFRGVAEYCGSMSDLTRLLHSGQARAYLFLGALITLFSSLVFLWEGR